MHYLHMLRTDPAWYLQKLWWTAVLFGGLLIVGTALRNRRRNRRAVSEQSKVAVLKPAGKGRDNGSNLRRVRLVRSMARHC
jgi:hypothetical protein